MNENAPATPLDNRTASQKWVSSFVADTMAKARREAYAYNLVTGKCHRLIARTDGAGNTTLAIERNGVDPDGRETYAYNPDTGLFHRLIVVDRGGGSTVALEQRGVNR